VLEAEKDREIEILTNEITRTCNICAGRVKRLTKMADSSSDAAEKKVVQNIVRSCATRLNDLSKAFREKQKVYLGHRKRVTQDSGFGSIMGGGGGGGGERDEGFTDDQMHDLATAEEDVDERMREIQRIAKSVEQLSTLFKELATLVVEQGTILDRIDHNMEAAVVTTKDGVKQLEQAEKYQKSARPIKCMMVLMLCVCRRTRSPPLYPKPLTPCPPNPSRIRLIVIMVIIIIVRKSK
jgi:syntaxin 16